MVTPSLVVRRAVAADAEALTRFAEQTFRATFEADNRPEDMDAYCREAFTLDAQRSSILDASIDTLLVEETSQALLAYAQLRPGAPPGVPSQAPIELWRFYVDRAHHGGGIAARLMSAVVDAAAARHAQTLWLGVWDRNHRAQAFYRKVGFVDVGSHTFLLGADVQTDRLMARPLDPAIPIAHPPAVRS